MALSIYERISKAITNEWIRDHCWNDLDVDIGNSIKNPIDWTQYISVKLHRDDVCIAVERSNNYALDEETYNRLYQRNRNNVPLLNDLEKLKENLMIPDVFIDIKDFAIAIEHSDPKNAVRLWKTKVDSKYITNYGRFKGKIPVIEGRNKYGQLGIFSDVAIYAPKRRTPDEKRVDRVFMHIDGFLLLIEHVKISQMKETNGPTSYDVTPYTRYLDKVLNFSKKLVGIIVIEMIDYIDEYKDNQLNRMEKIMIEHGITMNKIHKILNRQDKKLDHLLVK